MVGEDVSTSEEKSVQVTLQENLLDIKNRVAKEFPTAFSEVQNGGEDVLAVRRTSAHAANNVKNADIFFTPWGVVQVGVDEASRKGKPELTWKVGEPTYAESCDLKPVWDFARNSLEMVAEGRPPEVTERTTSIKLKDETLVHAQHLRLDDDRNLKFLGKLLDDINSIEARTSISKEKVIESHNPDKIMNALTSPQEE